MDLEPDNRLPTREELRGFGFTPAMLAQADALRQEQRESGLSPEAFSKQLQERAVAAHERAVAAQDRLEKYQRGWWLPIIFGFVASMTPAMILQGIHTKRDVGLLITMIGTVAAVYFMFDPENPPPRRRLIGGLAIGAAIGGLLMFAEFLV